MGGLYSNALTADSGRRPANVAVLHRKQVPGRT